MCDEPENLVLTLLRDMRAEVTSGFGRIEADLTDIKGRLQRLERRLLSTAELQADAVRLDHRLDEVDRRPARLEDAVLRR